MSSTERQSRGGGASGRSRLEVKIKSDNVVDCCLLLVIAIGQSTVLPSSNLQDFKMRCSGIAQLARAMPLLVMKAASKVDADKGRVPR